MVKIYEKYQCSVVAVEEVSLDKVSRYGVIDGVERDGVFRVSSMVEKPRPESAPSQLAIIGRYILTPDIFEILRKISPEVAVSFTSPMRLTFRLAMAE